MGLYINEDELEIYSVGDYVLTTPDGEFLASWSKQPLNIGLVHHMINEAYKAGQSKGETQLAQVKQLLKE